MKFTKMHGIGNDFVVLDKRFDDTNNYEELAKSICHRRFSIGADGMLLVKESEIADIKMSYYNADGSLASMCGNGIRCFTKYIYENNIVKKEKITVETLDGIKTINIDIKNQKYRVDMGLGSYNPSEIPVSTDKEIFINEKITILDKTYNIHAVLMGVPHLVIVVDQIDKEETIKYGEILETHDIFPKNINVNFAQIVDKNTVKVSTWERGCGYTLGCGTGMSAVAMVLNKLGHTNNVVSVESEGGKVEIEITDSVYMIGPAVKICEGEIY